MKLLVLLFVALTSIQTAGAVECTYSDAARQSWKELFQRQLRVLDKDHAEQMSRIAKDIIDGSSDSLKIDLAGVNPNTPFKLHGREMSMLDLAASACQAVIVEQLVAGGANVDGSEMSTPLVSAAAHGQDKIVEFLLSRGAKIDKIDANGHTALEEAVRQRSMPSANVLISHGDDVNRRIGGGSARILDLVSAGTDPESKTIADELRRHAATPGIPAAITR